MLHRWNEYWAGLTVPIACPVTCFHTSNVSGTGSVNLQRLPCEFYGTLKALERDPTDIVGADHLVFRRLTPGGGDRVAVEIPVEVLVEPGRSEDGPLDRGWKAVDMVLVRSFHLETAESQHREGKQWGMLDVMRYSGVFHAGEIHARVDEMLHAMLDGEISNGIA